MKSHKIKTSCVKPVEPKDQTNKFVINSISSILMSVENCLLSDDLHDFLAEDINRFGSHTGKNVCL